ncbi:MAG TPA: plasma-membrane proton-efflux P-type ATPase [Candidatus Aquilonibacter sp.]|nr:plasma-membrane proton-efflux P-type ATPase [Candidatus Aquilonibacter sp.]
MLATSDEQQGLSANEAERRILCYGPNALPEETIDPFRRFLSYFWGPIPWMIEAAAALSALVRHWDDFGIILALLLINAGVGFWEEFQASNAVAALKKTLAWHARVKRDGAWITIPAAHIVPGDLVHVRIGDIIPADARLLEGGPIEVDQSTLTGESLPVERKTGDDVYSGSIVKQGESDATVVATGAKAYFGKTARLVESARTVSHFQRAVLRIGNYLIAIAIVLVALILMVAVVRGDPILTTLQFALILTIAAVPVAMPAVLSVTMAVGSRNLAKRKAIVTRLSAMEELAGVDVLCADKTGTLTQNALTLGETYCMPGVSADEVIAAAALASKAADADAIDNAVLAAARESRLTGVRVVRFVPFDPVHKRSEATVHNGSASYNVTKGAPQVVMSLCSDLGDAHADVDAAIDAFATRGYRSLGVARRDSDGSWRLLGILSLYDPPRVDAKATIEAAHTMGIRLEMVTGDQLPIARETARTLGLGTNILDASQLTDARAGENGAIGNAIERADGFAQVFPEHKFLIIDELQKRRHIVGMTGDGVNDAPALKKADAGIAVSGATDAARAAAAIVLMTPGLSVILEAIKESRKIFQRMVSYATYRIAETIRVLLFMTLSILVFNFYPVTAVMIVLIAILNDGAILSIAYDRVRYSNQPEKWNMHQVLTVATALGVAGVVASFGLFYLGEAVLHLSRDAVQTLMYLKLSVAGHLTIFVTRTRGPFWRSRPAPILLGAVLLTQVLATAIAVFGLFMSPIGWKLALFVWGYALVWLMVNDRIKLVAYRWLNRGDVSRAAREDACVYGGMISL